MDPRLKNRGYSPEALAALQRQTGAAAQRTVTSCGIRFKKHLSHYRYPLMSFALEAWRNYERGVLPYPGSFSDQPAYVIEIFQVLQVVKGEHEERAMRELERKQKSVRR